MTDTTPETSCAAAPVRSADALENAGSAGSAESGALTLRPSLADASAAAELFGFAAADFLRVIYLEPPGSAQQTGEEAVASIVFGLAALFEETSGIVDLPEGFTLHGAAERLRPQLAKRIFVMAPEDRELFAEDRAVVALAVNVFFEELLARTDAWLEHEGVAPESVDEEAIHAFLSDADEHEWMLGWAKRLLGS